MNKILRALSLEVQQLREEAAMMRNQMDGEINQMEEEINQMKEEITTVHHDFKNCFEMEAGMGSDGEVRGCNTGSGLGDNQPGGGESSQDKNRSVNLEQNFMSTTDTPLEGPDSSKKSKPVPVVTPSLNWTEGTQFVLLNRTKPLGNPPLLYSASNGGSHQHSCESSPSTSKSQPEAKAFIMQTGSGMGPVPGGIPPAVEQSTVESEGLAVQKNDKLGSLKKTDGHTDDLQTGEAASGSGVNQSTCHKETDTSDGETSDDGEVTQTSEEDGFGETTDDSEVTPTSEEEEDEFGETTDDGEVTSEEEDEEEEDEDGFGDTTDDGEVTSEEEDEEDGFVHRKSDAAAKPTEESDEAKQPHQELYQNWDTSMQDLMSFLEEIFVQPGCKSICVEFQKRVTQIATNTMDKLFDKFVEGIEELQRGGSVITFKDVFSNILSSFKADLNILITASIKEMSKRGGSSCFCHPEDGARELSAAVDDVIKDLNEAEDLLQKVLVPLLSFFDCSRTTLIENLGKYTKSYIRDRGINLLLSQSEDSCYLVEKEKALQEHTLALELALKNLSSATSSSELGPVIVEAFGSISWEPFFNKFKSDLDNALPPTHGLVNPNTRHMGNSTQV